MHIYGSLLHYQFSYIISKSVLAFIMDVLFPHITNDPSSSNHSSSVSGNCSYFRPEWSRSSENRSSLGKQN